MREVQVNAAYRWFPRLRLQDKVPDASTTIPRLPPFTAILLKIAWFVMSVTVARETRHPDGAKWFC
jgi:hypothetical protein